MYIALNLFVKPYACSISGYNSNNSYIQIATIDYAETKYQETSKQLEQEEVENREELIKKQQENQLLEEIEKILKKVQLISILALTIQ